MELNLKLFEQQIDPVILQRGLKYFKSGVVEEIDRINHGSNSEIDFIVRGTEPYDVRIELNGDEVVDFDCNCPYDMGPVCKHVVAAMFSFENNSFADYTDLSPKKNESKTPSKLKTDQPKKKKVVTAKDIEKIIDSLTVDELKAFVREECSDRSVKMRLISMFGDRVLPPSAEMYRTQIRSIIREAQGRYGYVEYRDTREVGNAIMEIIVRANDNIKAREWEAAFVKIEAVIDEAETILNCGDDSGGYLGATVSGAFMALEEIEVAELPESTRKMIFERMMSWDEAKHLAGWGDWETEFIAIAVELASGSTELDRIEKALSTTPADGNSWRDSEKMRLMAQVIEKRYSKEKADEFIYQHRHNPDFRKTLIQNAIDCSDYDKALDLATEGISSDREWPGLVNDWKEAKLRIYIIKQDLKNIAELSQYFFIKGGNRNFRQEELYNLIKNNIPHKEWPETVKNLISQIKAARNYYEYDNLKFIYIRDEMWDEYFKMLSANPALHYLEEAEPHFKDIHREEFVRLYCNAIRKYAEDNMGRDSYIAFTRYIRHIKKFGEKETAENLAKELKERYPKRRAMIEELAKL